MGKMVEGYDGKYYEVNNSYFENKIVEFLYRVNCKEIKIKQCNEYYKVEFIDKYGFLDDLTANTLYDLAERSRIYYNEEY